MIGSKGAMGTISIYSIRVMVMILFMISKGLIL